MTRLEIIGIVAAAWLLAGVAFWLWANRDQRRRDVLNCMSRIERAMLFVIVILVWPAALAITLKEGRR